ncbi:hypothetical protein ILYODFUR_037911 [Ilyodon furcidens]|uniref:Uncharacterized protein n=1 Tax=Ilyodon furcidens TaxID=33524 RepID=A0ABV0TIF7_9TELE
MTQRVKSLCFPLSQQEVGLLVKTYSTQLHKDQHAVAVYPPNRRSLTILWPLPTDCPLPKQTPPGPVNT